MAAKPPVLTSLRYYEDLRENASSLVERPEFSNLDIITPHHQDDQRAEQIALCHISTIYAMTAGSDRPISGRYEDAFAISLAAHHLNEGDNSLVPQVAQLAWRCPKLKFTVEFSDVGLNTGTGLETVIGQTDRQKRRPCAFVGAYRSAMSIPTSIITGLRGYPQVSGSSSSDVLNDKTTHPLFARTVGSDGEHAYPVLSFFRDNLHVNHLAVLHLNEPYANSFAEGLRESVKLHFPDVFLATVSMPYRGLDQNDVVEAIRALKQTRYRYILAIIFDVFDDVLTEAYRQGIAGNPEYTWIFSDSFEPAFLLSRSFERGSILHQVYKGTGFIGFTEGGTSSYELFSSKFAPLNNPQDVDFIARQTPNNSALTETSFWSQVDSPYAPFFYDATILLGLSACKAMQNGGSGEAPTLNGKEHYQTLLQQEFDGVTGPVRLDNATGTRTSTFYTYSNFVEDPEASMETHIQFKQVVTNVYQENWTKLKNFTFQSGTTEIPPDLPPFNLEKNHLSIVTRVTALIMCAIAILLAIEFGTWTFRNRGKRVVKASQPFFLNLICVGAVVLACAIIPAIMDLSWASMEGCQVACNAVLWLMTIGFSLIFSALFTKTYRTNKILNNPKRFTRITVSVSDVMKPMIGMLSVNILILSLMIGLHPLGYEVRVANMDYLRGIPSETYGKCSFGTQQIPYIVALSLVNFGILCTAIYQAWKARNLSTEFAESKYIFRALLTVLLVIFVCGPVVLLADDNPDAYIFVACAIFFVTSTSTLLWIFLPKKQFARKGGASQGPRTQISGIGEDHGVSQDTVDSYRDGRAPVVGELILSRMSQHQLIVQNSTLARELERLKAVVPVDGGDADSDLSLGG